MDTKLQIEQIAVNFNTLRYSPSSSLTRSISSPASIADGEHRGSEIDMGEISQLKGLGPKSEQCLNEIGIFTRQQLEELGAIRAFIRLDRECSTKPGLNFLYAMAGALEDRHWSEIAREEKDRLIFELEGYRELDEIMKSAGPD